MVPFLLQIARYAIQIGLSQAVFWVFNKTIGAVLDYMNTTITQAVLQLGGYSEAEAKAAAEEMTQSIFKKALENLLVTAATFYTKMPQATAERIGLTSKGWVSRKVVGKSSKAVTTLNAISAPVAKVALSTFVISTAWNLLTDWVWIGNTLGFMPTADQDDIQKKALSVLNLINAAKTPVYTAEKQYRSLTAQERDLIKRATDQATLEMNLIRNTYMNKFILYNKQDVLAQMNSSLGMLLLEIESLKQSAGLIPAKPVQAIKVTAKVIEVYDGDTILLDNKETVRFVGIDAPESTTAEGERSKAYLKARLLGKTVTVESDPNSPHDIYGRRLGVVYLDE